MGNGFTLEVPVNVPDNMPWLSRVKIGFHLAQFILIFLTLCVIVPVITTENQYYNGSQAGPNYTFAISILSIWIPVLLLYFPWAYDHQNRFKAIGKFALNPRTSLIFTGFYSATWAIGGIAMTAHANNPSHCVLDGKLIKKYGDDYIKSWVNQCNLGKAGAAFAWLTCLMWLGALICTMIIFWNEKQLVQQVIKENKQKRLSVIVEEQGGMDTLSFELPDVTPPPSSHFLMPEQYHEALSYQNSSYYHPPRP